MHAPRLLPIALLCLTLLPSAANACLSGQWITADGEAVLELSVDSDVVTVRLLAIAATMDGGDAAQRSTDTRNPDRTQRTRPLAGLELGRLHQDGETLEGRLYDPESGRTFSVATTTQCDSVMQLRAWVGLRVLGRSLVWVRPEHWRARADALLAAAAEAAR